MFLAMLKRGGMYAGIGAAAGAFIGAGSAWLASRSTDDQTRQNIGLAAPSLAQCDEIYENVMRLRHIVAAIEVAVRSRGGGGRNNNNNGPTTSQLYVALVRELDRLCALEQLRGSDDTYEPGIANKSMRYVQTVRACMTAIERDVRSQVPTSIEEFNEIRDVIESGAGDLVHNLSVQEMQYMERVPALKSAAAAARNASRRA